MNVASQNLWNFVIQLSYKDWKTTENPGTEGEDILLDYVGIIVATSSHYNHSKFRLHRGIVIACSSIVG